MNCGNKSTSGNVTSGKEESDMVGIMSLAHSVQYLFPFPVSLDTILNYGSLPTSGVHSVTRKSDIAEKWS